MQNHSPSEIIAHRGASFDAPENTLESFQLGLDQGADALECDLHLSKDGELVTIHDADLHRIADLKKSVDELNLAELKALDAGSWKASKWKDARIPTLAEVLDLLPPDRRIFIEVKVGFPALPRLIEVLEASACTASQLVLMEFDLDTVIAMNKAFPLVETLWLNKFSPLSLPAMKRHALKEIGHIACQHGLDGINLQNISQLDAPQLEACRAQGLTCYCWTVDDPERAAELIEGGINGIATNRPGWIREQLECDC